MGRNERKVIRKFFSKPAIFASSCWAGYLLLMSLVALGVRDYEAVRVFIGLAFGVPVAACVLVYACKGLKTANTKIAIKRGVEP